MASRKLYMRKWREANPDKCKVYEKKATQRKRDLKGPKLCKRCNIEIERKFNFCRPCYSIHEKEMKKFHNDKGAEKRKLKYDNRDKEAYNSYMREYQKGKKFREYQKKYMKDRYHNDPEFRERVHGHQRKWFKKRYHTDIEFREKHLAIRRHRYKMTKKSWYQLRLERIEKLKGYLEENK